MQTLLVILLAIKEEQKKKQFRMMQNSVQAPKAFTSRVNFQTSYTLDGFPHWLSEYCQSGWQIVDGQVNMKSCWHLKREKDTTTEWVGKHI